jgi:hypothetical protein
MHVRKIVLIAFTLLIPSFTFGQAMTGMDLRDHMLIKQAKDIDRSVKDYEGSPFLNEEFVIGQVFSTGKKYTAVPLRYNIFNDQMEFRQNDLTYALYPGERIQKVIIGDETYVVEKYEIRDKMDYGYLTRLDSGKLTVLAKKVVRFTDKQEAKALESSNTPAKFTRAADIYYYKIGSGEITKAGSLKTLISSLPDNQAQLESYAKKEKLNTRNAEDLKKLAAYYNGL